MKDTINIYTNQGTVSIEHLEGEPIVKTAERLQAEIDRLEIPLKIQIT